jgi:lipopolysaccharide transport system permease protein
MLKNLFNIDFLTYQFDVIKHLVGRNFTLRYKGSVLGILWSLLIPLSQLLVFTFIFGSVLPLKIEAYPSFLFIGVLPWNWFSTCVSSAGLLFIGNRDLIRKPNFIPLNLVIVDILANFITFLILLPILFFILIIYNREITIYILYLPIIIMIQIILTFGINLIVATFNVFYRDIQHIISIIIMLLFFVTPVFYSISKIPDKYKFVFKFNPMADLIECYRATFYYGMAPDFVSIMYPAIFSILICFLSCYLYFKKIHEIYDLI